MSASWPIACRRRGDVHGRISGIEYYLPEKSLTTEDLSRQFPEWRVEQIDEKTGIRCRHIAGEDECASDLAVSAARKLFDSGVCRADQIDFVLLCTQSPDYALPTTACLLQHRLGIPAGAGALDFNLGCSGFIYGLGLADGLVATGQAQSVLLITAETYSKYIGKDDKNALTIFGDAAAVTLISAARDGRQSLGPFVYGTDGKGAEHLIVPGSGSRRVPGSDVPTFSGGTPGQPRQPRLYMNGKAIFDFVLNEVPKAVEALVKKAGVGMEDVDLFVFHQANAYMMEQLRRILGIPPSKFQLAMSDCGNTVSSTIPIALKAAAREGRLRDGASIVLVGFGVGLSWGATFVRWTDNGQYDHRP